MERGLPASRRESGRMFRLEIAVKACRMGSSFEPTKKGNYQVILLLKKRNGRLATHPLVKKATYLLSKGRQSARQRCFPNSPIPNSYYLIPNHLVTNTR